MVRPERRRTWCHFGETAARPPQAASPPSRSIEECRGGCGWRMPPASPAAACTASLAYATRSRCTPRSHRHISRNRKRRTHLRPPLSPSQSIARSRLHHSARRHSRHAAGLFLLRLLGNHALCREQQTSHRSGVLQRAAHDLGRVDDTGLHQVFELLSRGVEAEGALVVLDLVDDDVAFPSGVARDPAGWFLDRLADYADADLLVLAGAHVLDRRRGPDQRHTTARHDAFLDRRAGRMQCILDTRLLLFHLDLGRRADPNHRDAADQLGKTLLEFFAVVVRGGLFDLGTNLLDAALDIGLLARAVDNRRVVLVDHDPLGLAEVLKRNALELDAEFFGDHLAAREYPYILEHRLAPITETGRLDRGACERAANLVDDQRRQRLALDVLGEEQKGLAGLRNRLEDGEQVLHRGDLFLVDQDVSVLE